jgi:hypothetical protein
LQCIPFCAFVLIVIAVLLMREQAIVAVDQLHRPHDQPHGHDEAEDPVARQERHQEGNMLLPLSTGVFALRCE